MPSSRKSLRREVVATLPIHTMDRAMQSKILTSPSDKFSAPAAIGARLFSAKPVTWVAGVALLSVAALSIATNMPAFSQSTDEDAQIAKSLAIMLRSGRLVISRNQDLINNPNLGNKGLDHKTVLAESVKIYQETTKVDPLSIDAKTRAGKLIRAQLDSISEVMDVHQQTINRQGVGFKGFIPALFARLTTEAFGRRAAGL